MMDLLNADQKIHVLSINEESLEREIPRRLLGSCLVISVLEFLIAFSQIGQREMSSGHSAGGTERGNRQNL